MEEDPKQLVNDVLHVASTEPRPFSRVMPGEVPVDLRVIEIGQEPFFYDDHISDIICLSDPKQGIKFISYIEGMVRSSPSYTDMVTYCRFVRKMNRCAILRNIYHRHDATIELHHYPLSLFDITRAISMKMAEEAGDSEYFDIDRDIELGKRIMEAHFDNKVTLVPLCSTIHEAHHEGLVFIPLDEVDDNWRRFVEEYDRFLPEPAHAKIKVIEDITAKMVNRGENKIPLAVKPMITEVQIDGVNVPIIKKELIPA
jgi:hypothetical protein